MMELGTVCTDRNLTLFSSFPSLCETYHTDIFSALSISLHPHHCRARATTIGWTATTTRVVATRAGGRAGQRQQPQGSSLREPGAAQGNGNNHKGRRYASRGPRRATATTTRVVATRAGGHAGQRQQPQGSSLREPGATPRSDDPCGCCPRFF